MSQASTIQKSNVRDIIGLNELQKSMLYYYIQDSSSDAYLEQIVFLLPESIVEERSVQAWKAVVNSHVALRSVFRWEGLKEPVQILLKEIHDPIFFEDLSYQSLPEDIENYIFQKDREKKIDITKSPYRITFYKINEENQYAVSLISNHILFDGWSTSILVNQFIQNYKKLANGIPLALADEDDSCFLCKRRGYESEALREFWKPRLENCVQQPYIDEINMECTNNGISNAHYDFPILDDICLKSGNEAAAYYLAWGIFLNKYLNIRHVMFGTTVSGRVDAEPGVENAVGVFIKTIPLVIPFDDEKTVDELLAEVQKFLTQRSDYEEISYSDIREYAQVYDRDSIYNSIVVIENYPIEQSLLQYDRDIYIQKYFFREMLQSELVLQINLFDKSIRINYNKNRYSYKFIQMMSENYLQILSEITYRSPSQYSDLQIVTQNQKEILLGSNQDELLAKSWSIHDLLSQAVSKCPQKTAVYDSRESLTYAEFYERIQLMSGNLQRVIGKKQATVALMMNRSVDMVISTYAVLLAGYAYVHIEPGCSDDLVHFILSDCQADGVIVLDKKDHSISNAAVYALHELTEPISSLVESNMITTQEQVACVIYASSSTQGIRGIALSHKSMINILNDLQKNCPVHEDDTYVLRSSYSCGFSIAELFGWVLGYGKLYISSLGENADFSSIKQIIQENHITHINFVPRMLSNFLQEANRHASVLNKVKNVMVSGMVTPQLADLYYSCVEPSNLVSFYGFPESIIYATCYPVPKTGRGAVVIGQPIANVQAYVLDSSKNLLPPGAIGYLYLAGAYPLQGYVNGSDLTADKCSKSKFSAEILYETGAVCRLHNDGNLELAEAKQDDLEYWRNKLYGYSLYIDFPTDFSVPANTQFNEASVDFEINGELAQDIKSLCSNTRYRISRSTIMLTAYFVMLNRICNQNNIVLFASSLDDRFLISGGSFALGNPFLPVGVTIDREQSVMDLLTHVQETYLEACHHNSAPLEQIISTFYPDLNSDAMPYSQAMYTFNKPSHMEPATTDQVKYFLKLDMSEQGNIFNGKFTFSTDAFEEMTIQYLVDFYKEILAIISSETTISIKDIGSCMQAENKQAGKQEVIRYPIEEVSLTALLTEVVQQYSKQAAVTDGRRVLTYKELEQKSDQLAFALQQRNPAENEIIGIYLERSLESIISFWGIIKAGKIYMPLDKKNPKARLRTMLKDSGADAVIMLKEDKSAFNDISVDLIFFDTAVSDDTQHDIKLSVQRSLDDYVYVLYTSGTTGIPKGVLSTERAVLNRLLWMWEQYPFEPEEVCSHKTTLNFVDSIWEVLGGLLKGIPTVILSDDEVENLEVMINKMEQHSVTRITLIPSLLSVMLEHCNHLKARLSSLKYCIASGEPLHANIANDFLNKLPDVTLLNLYGSSEVSADVCCFAVLEKQHRDIVPIGKPIYNTEVHILNEDLNPVPLGSYGEIFIGGYNLASGYVNNPELTAEKFMDFGSGKIFYASGDIGRYLPTGDIEYKGRKDRQFKIRGIRIEPGDIEAAIRQHPSVRQAIVLLQGSQMNAYIAANLNEEIDCKAFLAERIPRYMIPDTYTIMDHLPALSNGKIDITNLKLLNASEVTKIESKPENEKEKRVLEIWKKTLKLNSIGVEDDFFSIGGNSLKAVVVLLVINKEFKTNLKVENLFRNRTVRELCSLIEENNHFNSHFMLSPDKPHYEVSPSQQRIYVLSQIEKNGLLYNLLLAMELKGKLDIAKLQYCFDLLIERHESLRTTFSFVDSGLVQIIHPAIDFKIQFEESNEENLSHVVQQFNKPFDFTTAPLMRAKIVKLHKEKHVLILNIHHLICDGVSLQLLASEITTLYNNRDLPPKTYHYKDYVVWLNSYLKSEDLRKQKEFWMELYKSGLPTLDLPTDYPRTAKQSFEGSGYYVTLPQSSSDIEAFTKKHHMTMFMYLMTSCYLLLHKLTSQTEIVIGFPVAGRLHHDTQQMMGVFINTLAMPSYLSGDKTIIEFMREVKDTFILALDNQAYQFEQLIVDLNVPRNLNRNPLFDVLINIHNYEGEQSTFNGLETKNLNYPTPISQFDFSIDIYYGKEKIDMEFKYCNKLFKEETIQRYAKYFMRIVEFAYKHPDLKISEINLMDEKEEKQLLLDNNNTQRLIREDETFLHMFAKQVKANPEAVAVIFEDNKYSYRYLDEESDKIAGKLISSGVKKKDSVAFMMRRSQKIFTTILGVLKTGASYIPLDPEYPSNRINYILEHSGVKMLIAQRELMTGLSYEHTVLDIDNDFNESYEPFSVTHQPDDLAYIIYTSGSTGNPKGVMIENLALDNFIAGITDQIIFERTEKILCLTTVSFDIFALECYIPLAKGSVIVLAGEQGQRDMSQLMALIKKHKISMLQATPSRVQLMIEDESSRSMLDSISTMMVGGEALSIKLFSLLKEHYHGSLYNMYGPTETTVWSMLKRLDDSPSVTIGKPIANTSIYVLTNDLKPTPVGIPGDLYIGGLGLARGYLNNKELTGKSFITNPFDPQGRIYKTGDVVSWNEQGELVYIQRSDFQMKMNGYRIELGEIEFNMMKYKGIKAAVVDKKSNGKGDYLCGYYTSDDEIDPQNLRQYLKEHLPSYMVPQYMVRLDEIPLTPNKKVNRLALPEPQHQLVHKMFDVESLNETEQIVANIWNEILAASVGLNDNFFDHGGNSLLLMRLHMELNNKFPDVIDITDLFGYSTISTISNLIDARMGEKNKEFKLQKITLPGEFYSDNRGFKKNSKLTIDLEIDTFNKIENCAQKNGVNERAIVSSIFLYSLAAAADLVEVFVYAIDQEGGHVQEIHINFQSSVITGMDELIKTVHRQLCENQSSFPISKTPQSLNYRFEEGKKISILLCRSDEYNSIFSQFDLVCIYSGNGHKPEVCMEFDTSYLKKEKVSKLLTNFAEYLDSI
ncbi:non-ribosomal peptide synthetase [Paenibacillus sp.]|jgi:amino acid adenylation domain-containing protein|uniref:non-ribosomal peptide synthetase n=1 Tax=Paenibacillus sp. TaxID=58172 RepID=UPI00282EE64D|nr:non-ribosomal peptide synthetase [Paenibacillus sp.]MDR0268846.1 amino acid adenylation domain-containing protein [Paenibacillus sp.]